MYGGRKDLLNGDYLTTDDGWNYRGRGLKQLTGRRNYTGFNQWHAANQNQWPEDVIDAINNPDVILDIKYATRSAAWFWVNGKLAAKVEEYGSTDAAVNEITKIINKRTSKGSYKARRDNFHKLWKIKVFE